MNILWFNQLVASFRGPNAKQRRKRLHNTLRSNRRRARIGVQGVEALEVRNVLAVSFLAAMNTGVGSGPIGTASGDFNQDGKLDLVTANVNSNDISILLGTGSGTFGAATNIAVGSIPLSVATADFNEDGRVDLAVANQGSNNVTVLFGNGAGGFGSPINLATGLVPECVQVADFNGDGAADLVTANASSNNVSVMLGNGAGGFGAAVNFGVGSSPIIVAVADFNGDGKADLTTSNIGSNNVSVLLGTGTGSFGAAVNVPLGTNPVSIATGDFNEDGKTDLVTANQGSSNVSVLLGNGAGGFAAPANYAVGPTSITQSVTVGDYNGDGKLDLATANFGSNNISVLEGTGTGTFGPATNFSVGSAPGFLITGDVNRDGKKDLVVSNRGSGTVSVLLNSRAAVTSLPFLAATNFGVGTAPYSSTTADFNGDGKPDIAVANSGSNDLSVLLGNGSGTFGAPTTFAVGASPRTVTVGDFNGDGRLDLAAANINSHDVSVLLGTGTGSFGPATNFPVGANPKTVVVADFNGDGKPDLAIANISSQNISVLLGNGTGGFAAAANFAVGSNVYSVTVGDFNGDGKPDLATANGFSNNVSVLLGNGVGSFSAATNFAVGSRPLFVTVGDFNADGKPDLATGNHFSNDVSVLLGTGTGSFAAAANFPFGNVPVFVAVGDFNGDGTSDIAAVDPNLNNVSIRPGTGTGSFGALTTFSVGSVPRSITVGDFNLDGKLDLATANQVSNNVTVLLGGAPAGSISATVDGSGNLTVTDTDGVGKNNQLSISTDGTDLIIADSVEQFASAPSGWTLGAGNTSIRRPLVGFTGSITVNGALGNDTLTVSNSLGDVIPNGSITFNGGTGGNDTLAFTGGTTTSQTFNFTNNTDGSVVLGGAIAGTVNYTGLEPVTSTINATDVILNYSDIAETITVTANGAQTQVDSNVGGEVVSFNNPTGTLQIFAGSGADAANDVITFNGFGPGLNAAITVDGRGGTDTINLNAAGLTATTLNLAAETIAQTQGIAVSGLATLNAGATGNITLTNTANALATVAVTNANNASLLDNGGFDLGASTIATMLTVSSTGAITQSGAIGGAGGLTKSGTGSLTLSQVNTFAGNALINQGLAIAAATSGSAGAFGNHNAAVTKVQVASGATVDLNGQGAVPDFYYGFTIAGTGTSGQGALINNGANGSTGLRQTPNVRLSADATIGGTGHIYLIASGYAATSLDLNNFTLTKTGSNTLFLNTTTVAAGTIHIANGTVSQSNFAGPTASNASAANFTLANTAGATLALGNFPLTIGSISGGGATGGNVLLGANTLTVGNTLSTNYAGVISGTGGVTKTGTGTLTLSAVNTFTGTVNVNQGILAAGNGRAFGGFNAAVTKVNVASGGTVDINGQAVGDFIYGFTLAGTGSSGQGALINTGASGGTGFQQNPNITLAADATIGGTGNIYMINAGYSADTLNLAGFTLTKTGSNTFFLVNTTVNAGTINIANGTVSQALAASNASAANVTLANTAGATLALGGFDLTIASLAGGGATGGNVALGANTLTVGNASSTTYAGATSGTGGVVKTGTGTLTLSGTNAHGNTTISQGTIVAANSSALGTAGTVTMNNAATAANNTALLIDSSAASITINRPILVTNNGTGTTTLGTFASAGGNQSTFSGAITLAKAVTLQGSPAGGDRTQFTGGISGTGDVTIGNNSQRVIFVTSANTYAGNTTVNAGSILQLSDGSATAASFIPDGSLLTVDGTLNIAKGTNNETISALAGSGVVQSHPGVAGVTSTVTVSGGTANFSGTLTNGGAAGATLALTKAGAGTQTLSGPNINFTGLTNVSGGTLVLNQAAAFNSATTVGAAVLELAGALNVDHPAGFSLALNNGATLNKTNSGYDTFNSSNVTVNGTVAMNITNSGSNNQLFIGGGGTGLTGTGTLNITNTGTATTGLSVRTGVHASHFNGPVNVSGGVLNIGAGAATTFDNADLTLTGAILNLNGSFAQTASPASVKSLAGNAASAVALGGQVLTLGTNNGTGANFAGNITSTSAAGSLVKTGTGTQTISGGAKSFTGLSTINTGTLNFTDATTTGGITINSPGILELNRSVAGFASRIGFLGTISGNGTVNVNSVANTAGNSDGGWYYFRDTVSLTGQINVNSGVFGTDFTVANWSATTAGVNVAANAVFTNRGNSIQIGALTGSGTVGPLWTGATTHVLTIGAGGGSGNFTGALRGNNVGADGTINAGVLNITKTGTGTQTFSGAGLVNYTGTTTINNGTLELLNLGSAFNSSLVVSSPGILEIDSTIPFGTRWNYNRTISGDGTLNKTNTGVFGITGSMSMSGQINIQGGRLHNDNVTGNWTANTANVDISAGAVLDLRANDMYVNALTGAGEIWNSHNAGGGDVLFVGVSGASSTYGGIIRGNASQPNDNPDGAVLSLTKNGAGVLTLTGTNTYSGVTTVNNGGTLLVNGANTGLGTVNVNNTATLGGTGSIAGAVNMNNNSRLSPGASPETLATGSLTLTSGSFFDVEIGGTAPGNGVTGYDQVNVTGTVSLGNATLNPLQFAGFNVNSAVAQSYIIITNDGSDAVTGTFFNQPEGSPISYAGGTLYVSYAGNDGNDVVLYSQPTVNGGAGNDALVLRQVSGNPALVEFSLNNAAFVQVTSALPFLYNGNLGTDLLLVDTSNGDPISTGNTTFNGELLRVQKNAGAASDTVTYIPSAVAGAGTVTHATFGNINFTGTTNVDFVNLTTVNVQTATANDTLTIADGSTATNGAAVPAGYSIAAVADLSVGGANAVVGLRTVTNANLDTITGGTNGNDTVSINNGTGAHGNTNLTITTGGGTDTVTIAGALTVGGNIDISSQNIAVNALLTAGVASTVTLNAGAGAITTSGTGIDVAAQTLLATATTGINLDTTVLNITATNSGVGNINIDETNGANLLSVAASNGTTTVTSASGNLHVTSVAASTLVTLTATTGALTDANAGANNITGAASVLTAASGIGSLADPLDSSVSNLEASGGSGGVFVSNIGALTIGGIGVTTGVSAAGGDIVVTTTGAMTVTEDVTATGAGTDVTLTATDAVAAGQNLLLNGGATVSSALASVTLNAGDNATITGNISSGTSITINVDAGDAESAGATAAVGDGGTLTITGIITTPNTAAGGAYLNGGNDYDAFAFNPQTTTEFYVDGDLPVGGTAGDSLQMTVTGTVNPNLTVPGSATIFNGKSYNGPGSGVWTFDPTHRNVRFTSIEDSQITGSYHLTYDNTVAPVGNLVVMLDGTASPNEKLQFRGSTTGGTVLYQTTLSPILSVRVLGGALNDTVTVDDVNGLPTFGGDVPGSTGVGDNPFTSDTGPSAPPEFFFDAGMGTNVLNFNLNQASTHQQYAIGTGAGPGTSEGEIQSTNAVAGLNTYFRGVTEVNRTGNVGATPGGLTVFGDDLGNVINVASNGSESRVAGAGYVPFDFSGNNFTALTVNAQAGVDTLDLISFGTSQTNHPLITLNGNTEDDTIRVRNTSGNTNTVTLNGNAGSDLFQLFDAANMVDGIAGPVIVDGTDGNVANNTDTLTIVDSGDGSGDSVVVSAVNAGANADYAVEGINGVVGNDVVFRSVDVLDYTGTADIDTIDGRFVNTVPQHDLSTVVLSGWLGADQFLLFTSDQIGGSGVGFTPSGTASGVASISLYGDTPGNINLGDGHDTFGETHPDIVAQGVMNVGLVVPDTYRLIRPSASTSIAIDGGQPTGLAAPLGDVAGDTHNLDVSALPNTTPVVVSTFGPGTVVATGIAPITWTQIENMNLVDQGKLTNVQMGDLFARTTPAADLVQITRNPTAQNPNQVRLRLTATIGNYSASNKTIIYGGGLNDTITQSNLTIPAEFYGEGGDDYLTGAMNNDWLVGGIGNDRINGSGGDNVIWGDNAPTNPGDLTPQDGAVGGDDQLSGLGGSDVFYGGAGNDLVSAGDGNDYASGGLGNDVLDGHGGNDRLYGGAGNDVISGHAGDDLLIGNTGDDKLYGAAGNDVIFAGSGLDLLDGGDGNDLLVSGSVANETSSFTSQANTSTFSPATYSNPADNDAALLALFAQWATFGNRGTLGTTPAITHDGVKDDLFGGLGDDDFCWELVDVVPGLAPADYNALGQGTDERFGPT